MPRTRHLLLAGCIAAASAAFVGCENANDDVDTYERTRSRTMDGRSVDPNTGRPLDPAVDRYDPNFNPSGTGVNRNPGDMGTTPAPGTGTGPGGAGTGGTGTGTGTGTGGTGTGSGTGTGTGGTGTDTGSGTGTGTGGSGGTGSGSR